MGKIYEQALHRRNKWPIHIFHSMFSGSGECKLNNNKYQNLEAQQYQD